jgi:hypothetical protein
MKKLTIIFMLVTLLGTIIGCGGVKDDPDANLAGSEEDPEANLPPPGEGD